MRFLVSFTSLFQFCGLFIKLLEKRWFLNIRWEQWIFFIPSIFNVQVSNSHFSWYTEDFSKSGRSPIILLSKLILYYRSSGANLCVCLPQLIGLGPHTSRKKQDLDKLYELKSKARQIMNQFGPSALINLSNFSSIKPEPASTPPQGSMANSTTVVKIPGTPGSGGRLSPENNQV